MRIIIIQILIWYLVRISILYILVYMMRTISLDFKRFLALSSLMAVFFGMFGYSGTALSAGDSELVIYSGRSDKFIKPVVAAFTKATGVKTVIHTGSSTSLLNKLKLEKKKTDADIFISNDAGNLQRGNKAGLFAPVTTKIASVIKPQFRGQDDNWIGISARARVLVVNTKAKDIDFVNSVFDLADPRLKGKIGITHSSNESYIAGVTVYMLSAGEKQTREWLKGLKKNSKGRVYNKHSKIVKAVAKGKKSVGLVNHYYIYRHLNKHPAAPIRILIPDQKSAEGKPAGIAWNVAGAAITKHSKKKELAMKFMAYVTSAEGQKIFAEVNREYPTRQDIPAAAMLPKADSFKVAPVSMYKLGEQRNATIDLIESVGMP